MGLPSGNVPEFQQDSHAAERPVAQKAAQRVSSY
jgi:hypothetical protein